MLHIKIGIWRWGWTNQYKYICNTNRRIILQLKVTYFPRKTWDCALQSTQTWNNSWPVMFTLSLKKKSQSYVLLCTQPTVDFSFMSQKKMKYDQIYSLLFINTIGRRGKECWKLANKRRMEMDQKKPSSHRKRWKRALRLVLALMMHARRKSQINFGQVFCLMLEPDPKTAQLAYRY